MGEFPNSILLVAIPQTDFHPLQPFDVDEATVRQFLLDGKDVVFVTCNRVYGDARLHNNRLVFHHSSCKLNRCMGANAESIGSPICPTNSSVKVPSLRLRHRRLTAGMIRTRLHVKTEYPGQRPHSGDRWACPLGATV
jgi:hypothetical protein